MKKLMPLEGIQTGSRLPPLGWNLFDLEVKYDFLPDTVWSLTWSLGCELTDSSDISRGRDRRWTLLSLQASRPSSALPADRHWPLPHRWAGGRRASGGATGRFTAQAAAAGPGLRQTAARQNSVHLRATGGSGEQVPRDSVPVRVRETEPGLVLESDRDPGENLVPEQEDQVEKAEPRGGQHSAARLQLPGERQSKPGHLWVEPSQRQLPPNFPQLQHWECDLPHGRCCSTLIHWRAPASLHVQWIRAADLL